MAKKKKSTIEGSGPITKERLPATIPMFDEDALSALTAKIEKGMESRNTTTGTKESTKEKSSLSKTTTKEDPKTPNSPHTQRSARRGVKRDANGHVKLSGSKEAPVLRNNKKGVVKARRNEHAVLLEEIIALGGSTEDLELVADAQSDDEAELGTGPPLDKSLQKDIARFVAGLGLDQSGHGQEDAAESETEENDSVHSDAVEDSHLESLGSQGRRTSATATIAENLDAENSSRLTFLPQQDWYAAPLPKLPIPEVDEISKYHEAVANLKAYASSLLEADSNMYASKHLSSSSSHKFLSTIMSSGTLSDKVSALTLVVQESPVHTTKSFENLLALARKRSRGQAVSALGALKDLLAMGFVLPPDRRLHTFSSQPGLVATLQSSSKTTWKIGQPLPGNITKAHLIVWAYEDWLKDSYFNMLKVLEGWCNDEVEYARSRAVTYVYELLKEKPEQEANLLRLLVNKLGDPEKKIASRASFLLLQLQITHPLMKDVIIASIENELLRKPGQSLHAKYYAINTLNQTILSIREEEVARRLLSIYFDLFVLLLKKPEPTKATTTNLNRKGQIQGGGGPAGKMARAKAAKEEKTQTSNDETLEKMISAVLTGVNRAFPFSNTENTTLEAHMDTLFRITHSSNFNTSVQALMLIEQFASSKNVAVDRFYRTLYESLLDPRLVTSSKHALYLNLLFRALKTDVNIKRVKAFVKRLLQVATLHQPPFVCGVIFLLAELETTLPGLRTLYDDAEEYGDSDNDELHDSAMFAVSGGASDKAHYDGVHHYDGRKRDPEYSHADQSCIWEMLPFLTHFHPSVSLFAERLLIHDTMPSRPDLASHSLTNFLDRFVYRNAKAGTTKSRGGSIMQPLSGGSAQGAVLSSRAPASSQNPLNMESFWRKKVGDIAVDEVFFHRYFNQISKGKQPSAKKVNKQEDNAPKNDDDEDEDEIWQALIDSRPELEGPSDDESDMEMMDLDDSNADSEATWSDEESSVFDEADNSDFIEMDSRADDSDEEAAQQDGTLDELFSQEVQAGGLDTKPSLGKETGRQRKKRLKSLPTFASMEDYVEMLDDDEDEDF